MTSVLDRLVAASRRRVSEDRASLPDDQLRERAERAVAERPRHLLVGTLGRPGVRVVAEIKRASPSRGPLAPGLDAAVHAGRYLAGGAAAVSVLTEPTGFAGSLADLEAVATTGAVVLRKDFLVDVRQVHEAAVAGAAAVLLIVAALDDATLAALHDEASRLGLDALVEVHDLAEVERARRLDPPLVGVNARDLRTFDVDRDAFARLRPALPDAALAVAESGIRTPDDVVAAAAAGADAVLVGESVVTAADPSAAVAALVAAGAPARTDTAQEPDIAQEAR